MSASDLDAWKALGPILACFVQESEARFRDACRWHATVVLNLIGASDDHPARALVAPAFADLSNPDLLGAADAGHLGLEARIDFRRVCIARALSRTWLETDESLELIDDPWESFWDAVADSALPWPLEPPKGALEALAGLADEISAGAKDPATTTWPVFPTGDDYDELIATTLAQVASRTGIALDSLPVAPSAPKLKELPMVRTDAAQALDELHDWASEREDLARSFGVLRPYLRLPP